MKQLLALSLQLGESLALAGGLIFCLLAHPGERGAELRAHPLDLLAGKPHLAIDALDRGLD